MPDLRTPRHHEPTTRSGRRFLETGPPDDPGPRPFSPHENRSHYARRMGTKLSQGRTFAPFYGWTKQDYEAALERAVPAPTVSSPAPSAHAEVLPVEKVHDVVKPGLPGLLEAIGPKLAWQRDALCHEYKHIDFFADGDEDAARAICGRCLCRAECLEAGTAGREHGLWGGATRTERARLRRAKVA